MIHSTLLTLSNAIGRDNFSIGAVTDELDDDEGAFDELDETFDAKDTNEPAAAGRSPA